MVMSFYLTPSAFSLEHVLRSPSMNPLLGHPLGTLAMSNLLSRSVWLHYAWCIVYLYLLVYGWLCTLYDGLSWLHEWPSLVISAFDLIEWICAKGYYCLRYIVCMITAMWSSRSMSPSDIDFLIYAMRINMFDALRGSNSSQHEHVGTHRIYRPETLPMRHNAPNTKLCQIFAMKMGHLRCRILMAKTW